MLIFKATKFVHQWLFSSSITLASAPDFQYFSFHLSNSKVFHFCLFLTQLFKQQLQFISIHYYLTHLLVHLLNLHLKLSFKFAFLFSMLILLKMQRFHYHLLAAIQLSLSLIIFQELCCFLHLRMITLIIFENHHSRFFIFPIFFDFLC